MAKIKPQKKQISLKSNKRKIVFILMILGGFLMIISGLFLERNLKKDLFLTKIWRTAPSLETKLPTPTTVPTNNPTPTILPTKIPTISFENMNKNFGPCVKINTLMYHHIQPEEEAKKNGQTNLTVSPDFLEKQFQYLQDKKYNVISMENLKNFFDGTEKLPDKPVLLTFDDGYKDNYVYMYPILKKFGYKATIFIPTGLLNNPDYLTWDDLNSMKDLVYFGNHTWSHHGSGGTTEKLDEEIGLADKQLNEHGYNNLKIFAYPFGKSSGNAESVLAKDKYILAFTTTHGNILCRGKNFDLPRIRVDNTQLNKYGL